MTIAIDGKYKNIQKKDKYLIWLVKKEKVSYRFVIKRNLKTAYFLLIFYIKKIIFAIVKNTNNKLVTNLNICKK